MRARSSSPNAVSRRVVSRIVIYGLTRGVFHPEQASLEQASALRWRIGQRGQHAVLDLADQHTMLGRGHAFDLAPFGIGHERRPLPGLGGFVRPFEQVDELGLVLEPSLPHRDDMEVITPHDPRRVVAKAGMEGGLVGIEDLVDAKLMDHDRYLAERSET